MVTARAGRLLLTTMSVLLAFGLLTTTSLLAAGDPRATGGGTFQETGRLSPTAPKTSTFVFDAITHANGTVTGHMVYHWQAEGTTWHMQIDCLQVAGNRAAMGGNLTKVRGSPSDQTFVEGLQVLFLVDDNGQGGAVPPDHVSDVFYGAPPCDELDLLSLPTELFEFPIDGDIRIQP